MKILQTMLVFISKRKFRQKAFQDYRMKEMELTYWRSTSKLEVDFVVEVNGQIWGIEVKSKRNPSSKDYRGLNALADDFKELQKVCICLTASPRVTEEDVYLLPVSTFLELLWKDEFFSGKQNL